MAGDENTSDDCQLTYIQQAEGKLPAEAFLPMTT